MNPLAKSVANWIRDLISAWDRFWFTPQQPHALALIRILGGAMLLYTHLIWSLDLDAFFGRHSWLTADAVALMNQGPDGKDYALSYLFWIQSPGLLWAAHLGALAVFAMLTLGVFSRATSILAWIITLSYCNRATGAWFGLDQINTFIALYLMLGPCGAVYSLDRWLARCRGEGTCDEPVIGANIAIRLVQVHMCVIYLFGGIGKMRGENWWDGSAIWMSFANLEYQSLDMTWMVRHRWLIALLTHVTVFWETFYCFLVWNRITRPICLIMAVGVHLGIGLCLGMWTFGLAMIIGNLAFVQPQTVREIVAWLCRLPLAARQPVPRAQDPRGTNPPRSVAVTRLG